MPGVPCGPGRRASTTPTPTLSSAVPPPPPLLSPAQVRARLRVPTPSAPWSRCHFFFLASFPTAPTSCCPRLRWLPPGFRAVSSRVPSPCAHASLVGLDSCPARSLHSAGPPLFLSARASVCLDLSSDLPLSCPRSPIGHQLNFFPVGSLCIFFFLKDENTACSSQGLLSSPFSASRRKLFLVLA